MLVLFFFFNDTATTEIYTLSLHDALPISARATHTHARCSRSREPTGHSRYVAPRADVKLDRKSTRLNSSHVEISYAVFCLKKKKEHKDNTSLNITLRTSPHATCVALDCVI